MVSALKLFAGEIVGGKSLLFHRVHLRLWRRDVSNGVDEAPDLLSSDLKIRTREIFFSQVLGGRRDVPIRGVSMSSCQIFFWRRHSGEQTSGRGLNK